eukprot:5244555-Pyramimonas_sp.AAC.1
MGESAQHPVRWYPGHRWMRRHSIQVASPAPSDRSAGGFGWRSLSTTLPHSEPSMEPPPAPSEGVD